MQSFKRVIVVLDKGFVFFGDLREDGDGWWSLEKAHNIRRYGTERGLGQLSITGPTSETVLDKINTVRFPTSSLQQVVECDEDKWTKY